MLLLYSCCTCWFTVIVVKLLFGNGRAGLGIRYDGIAAITAMTTVHRAQQNLHHRQKSTSSRYYRLTRLHVRSIDRLDLSLLCRSTRLQRLSIDSIDFKVYFSINRSCSNSLTWWVMIQVQTYRYAVHACSLSRLLAPTSTNQQNHQHPSEFVAVPRCTVFWQWQAATVQLLQSQLLRAIGCVWTLEGAKTKAVGSCTP